MGEVKWTKEQEIAINKDGSNILVAAAAGSGKTAVLVERIINKIVNKKIDIDKLLVVTFTNAAASEMRERILKAIYKKLDEKEDENLRKQILLLNKASISTIHSFCLDVIKNNFFEINISPNFRIGSTEEIELLKIETIEELFEEMYENKDEKFSKLINLYTNYKSDDNLKEIIMQIYKYIQSSPFPEDWLRENIEKFNINLEKDFSQTEWGKIIIESLKSEILDCILKLKIIKKELSKNPELEKYLLVIEDDIENLNELTNIKNWDELYKKAYEKNLKSWPRSSKTISNIKDKAKENRDIIRKNFNKIKEKYLKEDSYAINKDIYEMYDTLKKLEYMIINFGKKYMQKKTEKNIIDFNDIEHLALRILLKKDEHGNIIESDVAKRYKEKFEEIAIDEYQDSNLVQEYILTSISRGNNIFMVGDVKQSIYKFRQAMPELFLEKYNKYNLSTENEFGLKIQLFKNFRSRENVLNITNLIFKNIMSKELGDIDYNNDEFLNLGANYPKESENKSFLDKKSELHIIDLHEECSEEKIEDEKEEQKEQEEQEIIENVELEAKFVSTKIKELLESNYYIYEKEKYRKLTYKDIVILLRATTASAPIYERELNLVGIPVFCDTTSEYLESIEIQTIMSVLKIIDNPDNDIPLVTVLRSIIGGFSDNELIEIRLYDKEGSFYDSLLKAKEMEKDKKLKCKIESFIEMIDEFRESVNYKPIDELIWQIYTNTGYYNYVSMMPNGAIRQANLRILFERASDYEKASFKGLFNFIKFIDKLKTSNNDLGAAKLIGENEDVVRIMSIHKSKGLEFPVVFLCGTGKNFNMKDLNQNILLHQKLGLGPKVINDERRIEYNTLAKEAIRIKAKEETLSEEMRVLYVALTRAKEKLFITGVEKDLETSLNEKKEILENNYILGNKLDSLIIKKYKSYLDWLELVVINNKNIEEFLTIKKHKKEEILKIKAKKMQEDKIHIEDIKLDEKSKINEMLKWKYKEENSTKTPGKTSISKIKQMQDNEIEYEQNSIKMEIPKFINKTQKITNMQKGSLIHLCLQKLNLKEEYTIEKIEKLIQNMCTNRIVNENEAKEIDAKKILKFTQSNLYKKIIKAKQSYKEKPFYMSMSTYEVYGYKSNDSVLVQGIIDLYFVDENNKIILVDYKTDYVETEAKLVEKYKKQLELYKIAIEKSLNKKVDETYIYSTCLNKEILI